jgi:phosphoenolpyruvate---glycerone phosphotransferase subunit DhaK
VKKLINNPDDVVREELEGIQSAHGDLVRVSYDPMFVGMAQTNCREKFQYFYPLSLQSYAAL